MINHISIAVENPEKVAGVLAELVERNGYSVSARAEFVYGSGK